MARIKKISDLHQPHPQNKNNVMDPSDIAIDTKKKNKMMNVMLTGGLGATGVELVGTLPATDPVQQIGQLVLQILIATITIIKLLKDKKTKE